MSKFYYDGSQTNNSFQVQEISSTLLKAFRQNKKVLICGNGGSAAEAQHFAAELIGKFEKKRKALPTIALTTDTSALTAIGNDYGFEYIFSRQVEALGEKDDVLIVLSTSGKSKNCLKAIKQAKKQKMIVIDFPRKGSTTSEIQEYQLKLLHDVSREVENAFV